MFYLAKLLIATFFIALFSEQHIEAKSEKEHQSQFCFGMVTNRYLPTGTYVDCISGKEAIEVDFSEKWAEAVGQALHYASVTDKTPGLILICRETTHDEVCVAHSYRAEQTLSYWKIHSVIWLCKSIHISLEQCSRIDIH
jgi:hypothetical protein